MSGRPRAVVVGAGVSGIAAAQALWAAGVVVRVVDRGHHPGGRLGLRSVEVGGSQHVVDTGAAYFTVSEPAFAALAEGWAERRLAAPWTDTLSLLGPDGPAGSTSGPVRWAAAGGLRSLIDDLAGDLPVESGTTVRRVGLVGDLPSVDGSPTEAVVLAMPDPQGGRLIDVDSSPALASARRVLTRPWTAAICVYGVWQRRWWPPLAGGFVSDDDVLTFVADDGSRRGDDAPVLVAHTTDALAQRFLHAPEEVVPLVLDRLARVLGQRQAPEPETVAAHRWTFASPAQPHDDPYLLVGVGRGLLGVCGDGWGPRPRVEQAWSSGRQLGRALAERLAA